jgi:hypothetical protein
MNKQTNHPNGYDCFLLFLVLVIVLVIGLTSCTSTKEVTKRVELVDSTVVKSLSDSIRLLKSENQRLTADITELQYSGVRFDTVYIPGDTITNTVTITKEGEIKASGRVSAAYVSKSTLTRIISEYSRVIDSLKAVKQTEQIRTVTKIEYKDKVKKVSFIPFWVWILFAALLFWGNREKFKKLF